SPPRHRARARRPGSSGRELAPRPDGPPGASRCAPRSSGRPDRTAPRQVSTGERVLVCARAVNRRHRPVTEQPIHARHAAAGIEGGVMSRVLYRGSLGILNIVLPFNRPSHSFIRPPSPSVDATSFAFATL